jgi:predicted metal-dependent HD superfamily phosphohydrolase
MDFERSEETMGVDCQEVWRGISDYIDGDLFPVQRAALDQHFAECHHCTALLDSMRNIIALYRDERVLAPPDGFHERLHRRLREETKSSRRSFLAWALTAAAALPLGAALFSARKLILPAPDHQSPPSDPKPRQLGGTVAISLDHDDKVYHVLGCPRLRGKPTFISVEEAIRGGYTPCIYCIGKVQSKKNS